MSLTRRGFIASILAAATAPAFVRSVMPVKPVWVGVDLGLEAVHGSHGLKYSDALRKEIANAVIQAAAGATLKMYGGAPRDGGKSKLIATLSMGLPQLPAANGKIGFEVTQTVRLDEPGPIWAKAEIVDVLGQPLFSGPVNLTGSYASGQDVSIRDLCLGFDE